MLLFCNFKETETRICRARDQRERETLIAGQLGERQKLQRRLNALRGKHAQERQDLFKSINRHTQSFDRQAELRKLFEQEKQRALRNPKYIQKPTNDPEI